MEPSEMRYGDQQDAELDELLTSAREVAAEVAEEYREAGLVRNIDADLQVGGEDQPILVFRIVLGLEDDFAVEDWPADAVGEVKRRLRERVQHSPVDAIEWFVFVSTGKG